LNLIFTIGRLRSGHIMLVCHCHALTDRDFRRAARATGARSDEEVLEHCGAATGCGGCHEVVAEIVATERRRLALLPAEGADGVTAQAALGLALTG